jgi:hypothetical protein
VLPAVLTAARSFHGRILVSDGQCLLSQLLPGETTAAAPCSRWFGGTSWLASSHCQLDRALTQGMKEWCHYIVDGCSIFLIGELVSGTNGSRRSCYGDGKDDSDVEPGNFARAGNAWPGR